MKKIMIGILLLLAFTYFSNNAVELSPHTVYSDKWPKALDGYKIVHLADLQSKSYGQGQKNLLKLIENQNPDLIVFTGDLIDRRHYAKEPALELMKGCKDIAPTAYVTGNHEIWHGSADTLKDELDALGILVLDNKSVTITENNATFMLAGIADRADFMGQQDYETALKMLRTTDSQYQILLSHRPEQLPTYAETGFDLTFSGHSHGGQIRLPFVGGIIAPDQGVFPEFDGGLYSINKSTMIVSRGLGNSIFPFRIFNRPDIPIITMYSK